MLLKTKDDRLLTLDFGLSKLKEQTGNVHENKGPGQEVEESRGQEVEKSGADNCTAPG